MFMLRRPLMSVRPCFRRGIEDFFDNVTKPGETPAAGRAWKPRELRLKSLTDLHKLWFILLKERNKLLTEKAQTAVGKEMQNPARINKVRESMRGVKVVIGERMRLNKAEQKLALAKDEKEIDVLTKQIDHLRILSGTPAIPFPKEEVPYEERTVKVPKPTPSLWWKPKAEAKEAARAQRRKDREDPEFEAKEQARLLELKKQKEFEKAESTRMNRINKLKNRERAAAYKAKKQGLVLKPKVKSARPKKEKQTGKQQLATRGK